jgi:hypothetical protein
VLYLKYVQFVGTFQKENQRTQLIISFFANAFNIARSNEILGWGGVGNRQIVLF